MLAVPYVSQFPTEPENYLHTNLSHKLETCELEAALGTTKDTAVGIDGISYRAIRNLPQSAKSLLLQIYNNILASKTEIPESWFDCTVLAFLKPKKKPEDENSYRPISLLSCMRKLFEKMICTRLNWYLESENKLSKRQFGFRKGMGTRDGLGVLHSEILNTFSSKQYMLALFVDIKGAFNNVKIEILCQKMFCMNIDPQFVRIIWKLFWRRTIWIENFRQYGERTCYTGIPQVSTLSPTLYNIYSSDIEGSFPTRINAIGYADDLVVYCRNNNVQSLIDDIELAGKSITHWCNNNGMELSASKSVLVLFSRRYKLPQVTIEFNGEALHRSNTVKYLGMIFDTKLNWRQHIDVNVSKARRRLNFMRAISGKSWGAHPQTQLVLYKTIIRPHLEYGCSFFMSAAQSYLLKLNKVQWAALRIILQAFPSSPNAAMEVILGIQPLNIRFSTITIKFLSHFVVNINHPMDQLLTNVWSTMKHEIVEQHKALSGENMPFTDKIPALSISYQEATHRTPTDCSLLKDIVGLPENHQNTVANSIFTEYINSKYPEHGLLFTDGSKTDSNVGAAFIHGDCEGCFKLNQNDSVYLAEATALYKAIYHLKDCHEPGNYVIATDSLSNISHIQNTRLRSSENKLHVDLKRALFQMAELGYNLTFLWCPAHRGIVGNEAVDQIAKNSEKDGIMLESIERSSIFNLYKNMINTKWQKQWDIGDTGRFTYGISPKVLHQPWFSRTNLPRSVIRTVSRIMLNHYALNAHISRFEIVERPLCDCGINYQTIDHILWECNIRESGRQQFTQLLEANGSFLKDTRYLVCQESLQEETAIRIHTFLARHKLRI